MVLIASAIFGHIGLAAVVHFSPFFPSFGSSDVCAGSSALAAEAAALECHEVALGLAGDDWSNYSEQLAERAAEAKGLKEYCASSVSLKADPFKK